MHACRRPVEAGTQGGKVTNASMSDTLQNIIFKVVKQLPHQHQPQQKQQQQQQQQQQHRQPPQQHSSNADNYLHYNHQQPQWQRQQRDHHNHRNQQEPSSRHQQMLQSCGNFLGATIANNGIKQRNPSQQQQQQQPSTPTRAIKKPMRCYTFATKNNTNTNTSASIVMFVVVFVVVAFVCLTDAKADQIDANSTTSSAAHTLNKRSLQLNVECLEGKRFYRNPERAVHKIWTNSECAKYFLCLEEEVFEFKCSEGLLFDVLRQICDFKQNVDNCDITVEAQVPRPLLDDADCEGEGAQMGCGDGTCLPSEYFCDGSVDCPDASDEGWCDIENDPNAAGACDPRECQLPDCFCSKDGTQIPGRLDPQMVPQMIVLTFDDAVNFDNWDLYTKLLFATQRRNPNGCPIKATFFVSHQYTNYQYVQQLWNDGHEIAVHSITHRGPELWWSHNATIEDWFDEMVGQANILNKFASVRMEDIRGMRVPFLRVGWNRQFLMMKEFGFAYDASMVAPFSNPPLWPYTLDYKMPHACTGVNQNCPTRSYPGIWEMVMNQLEAGDYSCGMVDSCPAHFSGDDIYRMLTHNFKRHYLSNRAPYGLYFHSAWFKNVDYFNAFMKFLDDLQKLPDAYFVTNQQAIQWMRQPTPSNQLHQFAPWSCHKPRPLEANEMACTLPNTCKLRSRVLQQDRFFYTCKECPAQYPWLRNEFGLD